MKSRVTVEFDFPDFTPKELEGHTKDGIEFMTWERGANLLRQLIMFKIFNEEMIKETGDNEIEFEKKIPYEDDVHNHTITEERKKNLKMFGRMIGINAALKFKICGRQESE